MNVDVKLRLKKPRRSLEEQRKETKSESTAVAPKKKTRKNKREVSDLSYFTKKTKLRRKPFTNDDADADAESTYEYDDSLHITRLEPIRSTENIRVLESLRCQYTNILYANNLWVWIVNKNVKLNYRQMIVTVKSQSCPTEEVNRLWKQGLILKQIEYGDGLWVITADNLLDDQFTTKKQLLRSSREFPQEALIDTWRKGGRVVYLTNCNGFWFVIAEEETSKTTPQYITVKTTIEGMTNELRLLWSKPDRVSSFCYGNDAWVALSEPRGRRKIRQKIYGSPRFPTEKIKESFSEGRKVHSLTFGSADNMWAMIVEMEKDVVPQQLVSWNKKCPWW